MNPTEKEANAAKVPVTGSNDGKKTWLNTRAAAVPKMKKSYHSIVVPIRLAKATLRDERKESPRASIAVAVTIAGLSAPLGQFYLAVVSSALEGVCHLGLRSLVR